MIIKRLFSKLIFLVILLLFSVFSFETYEDFKIYQNNRNITEMTCEDFYNSPVKHIWVKLKKCEIDYDNILVRDLQQQILLPIKPESEKFKDIQAAIQVQINDSSIYDKFIELSQKDDSAFELIKVLSKIGMFEFSGVITDLTVISVTKGTLKSAVNEMVKNGKSWESQVEEEVSLYTLEWNKKPEFPSNNISLLATLIIIMVSFYIWRRIKRNNPLNK